MPAMQVTLKQILGYKLSTPWVLLETDMKKEFFAAYMFSQKSGFSVFRLSMVLFLLVNLLRFNAT